MNNTDNNIARETEKIIGYAFKDKTLLERAFTHSSYAHEHGVESYDRLEFLGDCVLGLVIAERLYSLGETEGEMTEKRARIVSREPLERVIDNLGLEKYLRFGAGEQKQSHVHRKVLSDLFEAIVGGIYLDGGYNEASGFILRTLRSTIDDICKSATSGNEKGDLQEYCQGRGDLKNRKIRYDTIGKSGSDHDPLFNVRVFVGEDMLAEGTGKSKRDAERQAAKSALKILRERRK